MPGSDKLKICQICKQDCSKKPRVKNGEGQYFCEECLAQKKAEASLLAGADPAPRMVKSGDEPASFGLDENPDPGPPLGLWDEPAAGVVAAASTAPAPTCGKCGARMAAGAVVCTMCGFNSQTGRSLKVKTGVDGAISAGGVAAAAGKGTLRLGLWLLGGGIAGAIGLAVWIGIMVATGYEIGYVAIGVGILIGAGVAITGQKHLNVVSGLIAAAIAFFCVAGWKLLLVFGLMSMATASTAAVDQAIVDSLKGPEGDTVALDHYVFDVAQELADKGKKNVWPGGAAQRPVGDDEVFDIELFPEDVRKETRARWGKLTQAQRESYKEQLGIRLKAEFAATVQQLNQAGQSALSFKDLAFMALWTILACGSAFSIGANGLGKD